jgi:phosphopantothenoylcysteine decarboxylase/phosphopantothenate--cysteine ligase
MTQTKADGRNIVLGVSGSIAAYKACSILRGLMRRGHAVRVVMTRSAQNLVTPATFRSLSGAPVATDLWPAEETAELVHIRLAEWVDVLAIAPATANIIGKVTCGIADEILSTTWMASACPKVIAPAMNDRMWESPAMQRNVGELRDRENVHFVDPVGGMLASGKMAGTGHLAPVEEVVKEIDRVARGK